MRNRLLTSERALPDNDMPLKQARDFILNSLLARRALCSQCLSGKLSIFLQDLIEEIYRLSVSCHMPEFTDHGLSHLCSLIERISSWTLKGSDRLVDNIEPDDAARLLLATLIHDLGMLSQKAKHLPADVPLEKQKALSPNISDWVRRTHVDRLPELFKSVIDELDFEFLGEEQKFIDDVIIIATSHDKWPWEWGFEDKGQRFLAGIVSVIDLLDEDSARCDTMTLIKHSDGNELNKAHWIRHCLTPERITINESHIRIALVKPSDWQDTIRLEPVLGALRNHFRLIKLYDTVLHSDRFDASLEIDFPNPEERSKELNGWQDIEGFESENAFCFQLLNTFMKPALNVIKEEDKTYFQHIPLEDVNLSLFNAINGKTPRHIIEKTFLALMDNEYNKAYKYLKKQTLEAHLSGWLATQKDRRALF